MFRNNKKKIIIFAVLIVILIIITILLINCGKPGYKFGKTGNNTIRKNIKDIEEDILAISKYTAKVQVTVEGNKNETKYLLEQTYEAPNKTKQVVIEPSNIAGLETTYDGQKLTITNSKLNMTTIYEEYPYIAENMLFLNSFIENYKNTDEKKSYEEANFLILEAKNKTDTNKYNSYQKLYISKETGLPTKLIIEDMNHVCRVYILYNEINME